MAGVSGLIPSDNLGYAFEVSYIEGYSTTTGRQYNHLINFMDVRAWILNWEHYAIICCAALIFTFIRTHLQKYFIRVAETYKIEKENQIRYAESSCKYIFYIISWCAGMYLVIEGDYWSNGTANCWKHFPNLDREPLMVAFYLIELGFYLHSIAVFFTMETKRSDSWLLLLHHFVTFWLLYCSFALTLERPGMLVLITHDFSDIFLELGKTFVYKKNEKMKIILLTILVISWVVTRLYILPFHLIWMTIQVMPFHVPVDLLFPIFFVAEASLFTLFGMHVYWFYLICCLLHRKLILGKEIDDDRDENTHRLNPDNNNATIEHKKKPKL